MKQIILLLATTIFMMAAGVANAETVGEKVYNKNCAMCHKLNGKGGTIGPDLSKIGARMKEKQIKSKIASPKSSNPTSSMPSFQSLSKADIDAIADMLKKLK